MTLRAWAWCARSRSRRSFPHLSVLENVRVALQRRLARPTISGAGAVRRDLERTPRLLDAVGVEAYADLPAIELPYGRKRALEIATTLALDPEMLLLDEPMAGMGTRTSSASRS